MCASNFYERKRKMISFIRKVKSYPLLWNANDQYYREANKKNAVWEVLAGQCGMADGAEARQMWKKLRCSYREAMRRRQIDHNLAPWKYAREMEFLLSDIKTNEPNETTIVIENDDDVTKSHELSTFIEVKDIKTSDDENNYALAEDNPLHIADDAAKSSYPDSSANKERRRRERDNDWTKCRNNTFDSNRSNIETSEEDEDALKILFSSMYKKTRNLPKHLQLRVQREVFAAVNRAEEEALSLEYVASS